MTLRLWDVLTIALQHFAASVVALSELQGLEATLAKSEAQLPSTQLEPQPPSYLPLMTAVEEPAGISPYTLLDEAVAHGLSGHDELEMIVWSLPFYRAYVESTLPLYSVVDLRHEANTRAWIRACSTRIGMGLAELGGTANDVATLERNVEMALYQKTGLRHLRRV